MYNPLQMSHVKKKSLKSNGAFFSYIPCIPIILYINIYIWDYLFHMWKCVFESPFRVYL